MFRQSGVPAAGSVCWGVRWPGDPVLRSVWRVLARLQARVRLRLGMYSEDMTDPGEQRIRILVSGRVQGVGFRAWVLHRGHELGVRGWVRNCRDGSVEVEASGPPPALLRLRELVADGPPLAHVLSVREEPPGHDRLPDRFEIR